jgi:sugar-specific transcriptional regulator TrmB
MNLGLSKTDAQVYIYLALNGPQKARELIDKMELYKEQLYRSLKNLKEKNIVIASSDFPAHFFAIPFEKVLDLLAKIKKQQAEALQEINEYLMDNWRALLKENNSQNNEHN